MNDIILKESNSIEEFDEQFKAIIYKGMPLPFYEARDPMFSNLSFSDFTNLIHRYYIGENTKELLAEYGISGTPQKFVSKLPHFYTDDDCPYCYMMPMTAKGATRDKSGDIIYESKRYCENCEHIFEPHKKCNCLNCLSYISDAIYGSIENSCEYSKNNNDLLNEVPLMRVLLAALVRSGQNENDPELIQPNFLAMDTKLAPTTEVAQRIIATLKRSNWIRFSEETHRDSIVIENGDIVTYYPFKATYRLNLSDNFTILDELISPNTILDENQNNLEALWTSICFFECMEYLHYKLDEYKLPDNIGPKTEAILKEGLKHYSTSQMFNHIWYAVKEAAAQSNKAGITKKHAVNTIAGSIQRKMERALAERWDIKPYGRDYHLPQSLIADVLFNKVLKISTRGFLEVPPQIDLNSYLLNEK